MSSGYKQSILPGHRIKFIGENVPDFVISTVSPNEITFSRINNPSEKKRLIPVNGQWMIEGETQTHNLYFYDWDNLILIDLVKINPDKPWDWGELSMNPNITMQDVYDNPDKPWRWRLLSLNPNITLQDILDNPDKLWNWDWLATS